MRTVRVAEELVQHEPGVARTLADAAVGDDVLVGGDALAAVERVQLVGGLEGAVLVDGLAQGTLAAPGCGRAGPLLGRSGGARISPAYSAGERTSTRRRSRRGPARRRGWPAAPAVPASGRRSARGGRRLVGACSRSSSSHFLRPPFISLTRSCPVARAPVSVGGEPVVVVAVEHDGRAGAVAGRASTCPTARLAEVVAAHPVVEVGPQSSPSALGCTPRVGVGVPSTSTSFYVGGRTCSATQSVETSASSRRLIPSAPPLRGSRGVAGSSPENRRISRLYPTAGEGGPSGREPVAGREAFREPELLELAHVALEDLGLEAEVGGQLGRPHGGARRDQAQDVPGPRPAGGRRRPDAPGGRAISSAASSSRSASARRAARRSGPARRSATR